jgi:hypothetical protein
MVVGAELRASPTTLEQSDKVNSSAEQIFVIKEVLTVFHKGIISDLYFGET